MRSNFTFINPKLLLPISLTLLLFLHTTAAEKTAPVLTSNHEGDQPKTLANSKMDTTTIRSSKQGSEGSKETQVMDPHPVMGSRQRTWAWRRGGALNANAHDVPSGPNPISN